MIELIKLRPGFGKEEFQVFLAAAYDAGASDITLQSGWKAIFHVHGVLLDVTDRPIQQNEMLYLAGLIYGDNAASLLSGGVDLDPRYEFNVGRGKRIGFRVNITSCRSGGNNSSISITLRALPQIPLSLDVLRPPKPIYDAMFPSQGLVIVAGVTGSGKSTLLAGGVRHILENMANHKILTYEKPIEYVYDEIKSHRSNVVAQHEIGNHLKTFSDGVHNALRRAPTDILVGESRDIETIDATVEATLTGHTTYTTVHAETVGGVVSRMVQTFPYEAQSSIGEKIVSAARLIIVQRLARKADGSGRIALNEWLAFGKEEKSALGVVRAEKLGQEIDRMVFERGCSMAHMAASKFGDGLISVETAAAAAGVSIRDIEMLAAKVDKSVFLTAKTDGAN